MFGKFRVNPLSANPTKWSNTLKQFVGNLPTNRLSVFDHFVGFALKGLRWSLSILNEIWITSIVLFITSKLLKYHNVLQILQHSPNHKETMIPKTTRDLFMDSLAFRKIFIMIRLTWIKQGKKVDIGLQCIVALFYWCIFMKLLLCKTFHLFGS